MDFFVGFEKKNGAKQCYSIEFFFLEEKKWNNFSYKKKLNFL